MCKLCDLCDVLHEPWLMEVNHGEKKNWIEFDEMDMSVYIERNWEQDIPVSQ